MGPGRLCLPRIYFKGRWANCSKSRLELLCTTASLLQPFMMVDVRAIVRVIEASYLVYLQHRNESSTLKESENVRIELGEVTVSMSRNAPTSWSMQCWGQGWGLHLDQLFTTGLLSGRLIYYGDCGKRHAGDGQSGWRNSIDLLVKANIDVLSSLGKDTLLPDLHCSTW